MYALISLFGIEYGITYSLKPRLLTILTLARHNLGHSQGNIPPPLPEMQTPVMFKHKIKGFTFPSNSSPLPGSRNRKIEMPCIKMNIKYNKNNQKLTITFLTEIIYYVILPIKLNFLEFLRRFTELQIKY